VAGGGGTQWTEVQRPASAQREEEQRRGMSGRGGLKGGARRRGAPFKAARGGGRGGGNSGRRIQWVVRRWSQSIHGQHGRHRGSDRLAGGWAPTVLIFSQIIQTNSNLEIKKECVTMLQKLPTFACC
jgi:hypothetical protein